VTECPDLFVGVGEVTGVIGKRRNLSLGNSGENLKYSKELERVGEIHLLMNNMESIGICLKQHHHWEAPELGDGETYFRR